jgi:CheY-like chemotaxis protein
MSQDAPIPPEVSTAARFLSAQRRKVARTCEECGKVFQATLRGRYCSNACNVRAWRRAQQTPPLPAARTGHIPEGSSGSYPQERTSVPMTNVLLLSTRPESMGVLQDQLQQAGYPTRGQLIGELQSGQRNYLEVLAESEPDVIVYDLAPPYPAQWSFYELLRSSELSTPLVFILTSSDKPRLEQVVGEIGSLQFTDDPLSLARLVAELQRVAPAVTIASNLEEYPEIVVLFPTSGERSN